VGQADQDRGAARALALKEYNMKPYTVTALYTLALTAAVGAKDLSTPELVRTVAKSIVRVELAGTALKLDSQKQQVVEVPEGGSGTGFVVTGDGYIVTNSHVVHKPGVRWKAAPILTVEFNRSDRFVQPQRAELVAHDELSDLAVLKLTMDRNFDILHRHVLDRDGRLRHLRWADPKGLEVGQEVVAVGFPRSQDGPPTVTKGVISALGRSFPSRGPAAGTFSGLIQTDAAINPGNSGGPLLNLRGEVVGVNTYRFAPQLTRQAAGGAVLDVDTTEGISFARACATAEPLVERLKKGPLRRAALGFRPVTITRGLATDLAQLSAGAFVAELDKGGPAEQAGLKPYDLIFQIVVGEDPDDVLKGSSRSFPIHCAGDLHNALAFVPPGHRVLVQIRRPSQEVLDAIAKGEPIPPGLRAQVFARGELKNVSVKSR
jgi:S1-C subfamily serine protease